MAANRYFVCISASLLLHGLALSAIAASRDSMNLSSSGAGNDPKSVSVQLVTVVDPPPKPAPKLIQEDKGTQPPKLQARHTEAIHKKPQPRPKERHPKKVEAVQKTASAHQADSKKANLVTSQPRRVREFELLHRQAPNYPKLAKQRDQQGLVLLEVELNKKGQQLGQKLLKSSGYALLDQSALRAVRHWKFAPFSGSNTPRLVEIPVRFVLES
ncbi:energy transducer TonB [Dongshaea marina]|uniref:energy transducer TonB n=1 Tax=Dongshaea marina TaxID=2047966 RepID=UPI000D3EB865|nr:energy transducer TonB [Dongshaea marina]